MYGRNLFKKSIVSKVGWDPSPSLEQEKEKRSECLVSLSRIGRFLHLSLTASSRTFPVILELVVDWLSSENPSVQHPVTSVLI